LCHESDDTILNENGWCWDEPGTRAPAITQVTQAFIDARRKWYSADGWLGGERTIRRLKAAKDKEPRPIPYFDLAA
jgi:hypothetical protein